MSTDKREYHLCLSPFQYSELIGTLLAAEKNCRGLHWLESETHLRNVREQLETWHKQLGNV